MTPTSEAGRSDDTHRPVFFVTVDTEEDDWGAYEVRDPSTTNIRTLPRFQDLCDRYGAIPTYLVNWPVARAEESRTILRELIHGRNCELGTHIHPWNTPPYEEEVGPRNSMLSNLPRDLVDRKLTRMHYLLVDSFGITPRSFRAGRWGFSGAVAEVLERLGYLVDSSVCPFIDWRGQHGPDYSHAPRGVYRFEPSAPLIPRAHGPLVQVPVTVGFFGARGHSGRRLRDLAGSTSILRLLKMVGLVDRLGLAARRWLSPEVSSGPDMIRLMTDLVAAGETHLNFTFHSPSLAPGLTPFVTTPRDVDVFNERIEQVLAHARDAGYRFAPLLHGPELCSDWNQAASPRI